MLDPGVVKDFLEAQISCSGLEIPPDIEISDLVSAFVDYTENDYYEWLKDNFKSFFNHSSPDWDRIRTRISNCQSNHSVL